VRCRLWRYVELRSTAQRVWQSRGQKGAAMSGPFIFIATNRLKPGKLADGE